MKMDIFEMISNLKKESIQLDFLIVLAEMKEELKGIDDYSKFRIISKTIELSHRSVIASHKKISSVPKSVYCMAIKQGNIKPIDFVKKWIDGSLEDIYMEELPINNQLNNKEI